MFKLIQSLRNFYGISFFLVFAVLFSWSLLLGIMFLLSGMFLFPPAAEYLEERLKRKISRRLKVTTYALTAFIALTNVVSILTDVQREKAAQKQREDQVTFQKLPRHLRDSIIKARNAQALNEAIANEIAERKELVDKKFSSLDGSHKELAYYIKQHLHDPDSYEHVETRWKDLGDRIEIYTTIRANNQFGARVMQNYHAFVTINDEIISLTPLE